MPKIRGAREKRHQPFWDTLIRGDVSGGFEPRSAQQLANGDIRLFNTAGQGSIAVSNMEGAGAFPSDQTYRILAMRVWLYFRGTAGDAQAGYGYVNDFVMYHHAVSQLYWELQVAGKQAFLAPTPYLPLGGGLHGDVGADTTVYFNNGTPSQSALMKLARSIALPARQNFFVRSTIAPMGNFNLAQEIQHLSEGEVNLGYFIDGLHVRDIL
jgi:hypothetical protein